MSSALKRTIGLPVLTLYGLGNILGAGIYVLVGKVAGDAGSGTTFAFLIAMAIAGLTALSYMELSARFPVSASVSVYTYKAFKKKWLSLVIGLAMIAGGITSAAALSQGFAGYFNEFISLPTSLVSVGLLIIIGFIAIKGIGESTMSAAILTVIEIAGLVLVIWAGRAAFGSLDTSQVFSVDTQFGIGGILAGAFLAFYAFIGFEDLVNVGEEAKQSRKNMPLAILLSLIISTFVYLLIVLVSLSTLSVSELAASDAPLALVYENAGGHVWILGAIGMVAAANGIVVQMIMGSRFLYGLSKQGWLHARFSVVNQRTKTPVIATVSIALLMIAATLLLPLVSLAQLTSFLILVIFALVNCSLIVIKKRSAKKSHYMRVPAIVPIMGAFACFGLIVYQVYQWI